MSTKIQGVSMPRELVELGKARAKNQGRSFSAHVRWLLQEDLNATPTRKGHGKRDH
jgi:hypothetical protein